MGYHWLHGLRDNGCLWKRLTGMFLCTCKVGTMTCLSSVNYRLGITVWVNGRLFPYSFENDHTESCCPTSVLRSLIHCTFPCHGFLALPATGIVPLFAVHLAVSAPFTCPNVCSVHLAMSTCLALSNQSCLWAFPARRKGDNLPLRPQTAAAGHKPDRGAQQRNYSPFI